MIDINSDSDRENILSDLVPDLTPLLDVMFMLVVFLVLTTNTIQQVFDVKLPEDKNDVTQILTKDETIRITIFSDKDLWAVDKEKFNNFHDLKRSVIDKYNQNNKNKFIIYGDKQATIDRLMNVLTFLRSENIEAADIIME